MQTSGILNFCDRCGQQCMTKPAFGNTADLCAVCSRSFEEWFARGRRAQRISPGTSIAIARQLETEHGWVTPQSFAAATGKQARAAYDALKAMHRHGRLRALHQPYEAPRFAVVEREKTPGARVRRVA